MHGVGGKLSDWAAFSAAQPPVDAPPVEAAGKNLLIYLDSIRFQLSLGVPLDCRNPQMGRRLSAFSTGGDGPLGC